MSVTLTSVADALIEFILSLLRDPDAVEKFNTAPQAMMASRGLSQVQAHDVCAVAPIIAERHDIIHMASAPRVVHHTSGQGGSDHPAPASHAVDPVTREVQNIVNNLSWVDDRDTIVDQSVNQNIWAEGDVTQNFDQAAIVSSGDDAIAAGNDVDIDMSMDDSTTITAGNDANVGNTTTDTTVDDSYNAATDASTTTDASTATEMTDSANDSSVTETADESYNSSASDYAETTVDTDSNSVFDSTDTVIVDEASSSDGL